MKDDRWHQIKDIFNRALELEPGEQRAFLAETCADDANLLEEVKLLLDSFASQSLEQTRFGEAATFAGDEHLMAVGQTISHYKILKKLGVGGMGEVYLAEDTRLDRTIAIKVLSAEVAFKKESMRRFEQEAKAASALNHPNILTIYEFGEADGVHFIATEFIDGQTLRRHFAEDKKHGRLKVTEALEIAIQIASALIAAHDAGIIHRDIKPENIMLRRDGYVKVLDFGLAKLAVPKETGVQTNTEAQTLFKTTPGIVMGTVAYMSPEQARGLTVDERTDIWSLGVVLYEMVTGDLPFGGSTQTDVLVAILDKHPPTLRYYIDSAPAELERIIDKTLAKNVEERYQGIKDLALDLKSLKGRLEFEAELVRSNPPSAVHTSAPDKQSAADNQPAKSPEAVTQIIQVAPTASITPPALEQVQLSATTPQSKKRLLTPIAIISVILLVGAIGVFIWKSNSSETTAQPTIPTNLPVASDPAVKPSRLLNYSLTVQSYNDGRYKNPFQLSGEMLFRNKDRVRLNIKSPQTGYLYILNQGPKNDGGESSFNILFPSPTTNDGSAHLSANQEIQIPQQSWFELDSSEGTELVWLIWSENALSELESAKRFANPEDKGKIKDPALIKFIESLFREHQSNKAIVEKDDDKKESQIRANTDILAHVIKLEHH